ncbi:flagellar hook-associated protein FlgK [Tropicibacter oceani]|uniref:Flagellar hook-associated protein 1 n=1 Tax=Tropicibacter oceani TaxID=3058420 RepID=A0ABY8QJK6_9RHOB|nr:flagellar hook-associated protein FlgK [Tropicibacter oceani]WGW04633.1 flagellar hook-associated protein FlgK [Tropicibacter oceani]
MSLTGALYNAFSGLKANSRAAALVSTNISNATTESYGRRELALSAGVAGTHGGVTIKGVIRHSDPVLTADRRLSDANMGAAGDMYTFARRMEDLVGESGTSGSLTDRVTSLENALINAASNPAATQRLENIATTANDLAKSLNKLSDEVQLARQGADATIARHVTSLNEAVVRLDEINDDVVKANSTGGDVSTLLDERQRLIDGISEIVPLRVVARERGEIALFTQGGAVLLDGRPVEVGFEQTPSIGAGMSLSGGQLNGLTLAGLPVNSTESGMFAGGRLGAQFELRDVATVERQAQLDGIARDLIDRLGPGGPDSTLGALDPGLFTDAGIAFDPLNENGIAGRIEINALVAPGSGQSWKLRDGLGAATQGEVGDASLLVAISAALEAQALPGSAALDAVPSSFINQVANFGSDVVGTRVRAENEQTFAISQNTGLKEIELSKGVDTDFELQMLMQIEQLYTANAKVMSTVDQLLERLMSI